jgi:hypothetical protein
VGLGAKASREQRSLAKRNQALLTGIACKKKSLVQDLVPIVFRQNDATPDHRLLAEDDQPRLLLNLMPNSDLKT